MTTNVILRRCQDEQYILEEKMTSINESTTNVLIKNLKSGVNASTVVSRYAQATLTAVPILPDSPSWVEPIKLNLITAQEYASTWLKIICPCIAIVEVNIDISVKVKKVIGKLIPKLFKGLLFFLKRFLLYIANKPVVKSIVKHTVKKLL